MNIATIILATGENVSLDVWQGIYGLPRLSSKIGKYITLGEPNVRNGLTIAAPIIQMFDYVRIKRNKPMDINSLDRYQSDQDSMLLKGVRAATTSPHVYKMAVDIDTISKEDTIQLVADLKEAAKALGFKIRIGYKVYLKDGKTFVHLDCCPMYYAPGKPFHHHKHPAAWENEITW